eukprot:Awhi_evm2s14906
MSVLNTTKLAIFLILTIYGLVGLSRVLVPSIQLSVIGSTEKAKYSSASAS